MIAVIFEFTPAAGRFPEYMDLVAGLKADLEKADGFISLERFESITTAGKIVSLQFWRGGGGGRRGGEPHKHPAAPAPGRARIFSFFPPRPAPGGRGYTKGGGPRTAAGRAKGAG